MVAKGQSTTHATSMACLGDRSLLSKQVSPQVAAGYGGSSYDVYWRRVYFFGTSKELT